MVLELGLAGKVAIISGTAINFDGGTSAVI